MKRMIIALLTLLSITSCMTPLKLLIKFSGETEIMPRSDVMHENQSIGKVVKVEFDGRTTLVTVIIDPEHRGKMNTRTMFFRVFKDNSENVVVLAREDKDAKNLEDGQVVDGMGGVMYYALRAGESAADKIKSFFNSEEWNEFKSEVIWRINSALNKTKEEIEGETEDIRKKATEFAGKMKEKYGEDIERKVREFTDSLTEELKLR